MTKWQAVATAITLAAIALFAFLFLIQNKSLETKSPETPEPSPQPEPIKPIEPAEPERLEGTPCNAVIPGHNQADYERANIIFVGFNLNEEDFLSLLPLFVDYNGTGFTTTIEEKHKIQTEEGIEVFTETGIKTFYGLLGTDPFRSNKNKFNFWYIEPIQPLQPIPEPELGNSCGVGEIARYCISQVEQTCGLKNIYPVYICNTTLSCASYGSWSSNKAYIDNPYSLRGKLNPYSIRTIVHEFGHSFGGLRDEYFGITGKGDSPGPPNCAPDLPTAGEWWGDLLGQGEGDLAVGFYEGCSYTPDNIRPTNSSIMRSSHSFLDFGLVNERHLEEKLDLFSGEYSEKITEKDPVAQRNATKKRKK